MANITTKEQDTTNPARRKCWGFITKMANSPTTIGGFYLALIPIFGAIYTCLPGQFYHSTSIHEPYTHQSLQIVSREIQAELRRLGHCQADDESIASVDFRTALVLKVSPQTEILNIEIKPDDESRTGADFRTTKIVNEHSRTDSLNIELYCIQNIKPVDQSLNKPRRMGLEFDFIQLDDGTVLGSITYIRLANGRISYGCFPEAFRVQPTTFKAWTAYRLAIEGFPSGGFDHWLRMTYFSAITITTVGFGDILPLTNWARFWVALQAISGVVLAGIFLNAITNRIKGTSV